jgi:hypothetical protein
VGKIKWINSDTVTRDGEPAETNDPILAKMTLRTDSEGDFDLHTQDVELCRTASNTTMVIRPDANTAIRWSEGESWCAVSKGAELLTYQAGEAIVRAHGTVFGVTIDGPTTTVKVASGKVELSSASPELERTVDIEAGQQASIKEREEPSDPVPLTDLSERDLSAIKDLCALVGDTDCAQAEPTTPRRTPTVPPTRTAALSPAPTGTLTTTPSPTPTATATEEPGNVVIVSVACNSDPEVVEITNLGPGEQDLTGWRLESDPVTDPGQVFNLSQVGVLDPQATVSVFSGSNARPTDPPGQFRWDTKYKFRDGDPDDFARIVDDEGIPADQANCAAFP